MEFEILPIFPTPVFVSKTRLPNHKELSIIEEQQKTAKQNHSNRIGLDRFVLDKEEMSDLKDVILNEVDKFKVALYGEIDLQPEIQNSWLNFLNQGEHHHRHNHPNSMISGVYYVSASDNDGISFLKGDYQPWSFPVEQSNVYNSNQFDVGVNSGIVVLFPSSLMHYVNLKTVEEERISLAFNVLLRGELGNSEHATFARL